MNAGQILVRGLGVKTTFPVRVSGAAKFSAHEHGGVVTTSAGSLGVDFSGKSGAGAVLVLSGPVRGQIAPSEKGKVATRQVTAGANTFVVMSLAAHGAHPAAEADGDRLRLGAQVIGVEDGRVTFQ